MTLLRAFFNASGGVSEVPIVAGRYTVAVGGFEVIGSLSFNPNGQSFNFEVIAETTSASLPCEIRFYNATDDEQIHLFSINSLSPLFQSTSVILPSGDKRYEVQMRMVGVGISGNHVTCTMARLRAQ